MTDAIEDGMLVSRTAITLANGASATRISVPIVTGARVDTIAPVDSAQIKIGAATASLPTGFGLTAITSDPLSVANSAAAIKAAIDATPVTHSKAENAYLSSDTLKYVNTLSATDQVSVVTYAPVTGTQTPAATLNLDASGTKTAVILDLSQTAVGSTVSVNAAFTAVLGSGIVNLGQSGQFVVADDGNQAFSAPIRGGTVYAGGGNDSLSFDIGLARIDSLFHGGKGFDTVSIGNVGIEQHAGYVILRGGHEVQLKLINVEQINMAGQLIDITATTQQTAIATLYQNILGRQPDLTGFEYWDNQVNGGQTLGQVAITMTRSTESGNTLFNGNTSHDLDTLYNVILHRATDPIGKAYWSAQIDQGHQTIDQVAQGFVTSNELVAAYVPQTQWDFLG